jgi:very-short-patch-repair endonuclease
MRRRFIPYRRDLKRSSQSLRRDPSPAERKLWYEFLRSLPVFSDRAQQYDERRTLRLEAEGIKVLRFTNAEVMQDFEGVCGTILRIIEKP